MSNLRNAQGRRSAARERALAQRSTLPHAARKIEAVTVLQPDGEREVGLVIRDNADEPNSRVVLVPLASVESSPPDPLASLPRGASAA